MNYCYKVVAKMYTLDDDGNRIKNGPVKYISSFTYVGEVEYKIGEVTRPTIKGTPLFVFSTSKAAKDFINHNSNLKIMVCEHGPVMNKKRTMLATVFFCGDKDEMEAKITDFWKDQIKYDGFFMRVPDGTMLVEWVKPVRMYGSKNGVKK
jgi:hypothetical protein